MTTQYKLQKDVAGYNGFGLPPCDQKFSASLAATTDTTLTVPSSGALGAPLNQVNRFLAVIQVEANLSVWLAINATAAVPVGGTGNEPAAGLTGAVGAPVANNFFPNSKSAVVRSGLPNGAVIFANSVV